MTPLDRIDDMMVPQRPKLGRFDPSRFGHPLAVKTQWAPLRHGGSNFRTHRSEQPSPERFEFRPTAGAKIFPGFFAFFGLVPAGVALWMLGSHDSPLGMFVLLPALLLLAIAWFLWNGIGRPIVFDRREGWFWKGGRPPSEDPSVAPGREACALSEIGALQIIPERINSRNGGFGSWELNLVLTDGTRRNVVDHGSESTLRQDAQALAAFLSVPLWDIADGFHPEP